MRDVACGALVDLFQARPFVFLTGDVGFMALERLRNVMGSRFINAGVAEQNMVSVAAGIASEHHQCWVYSIAPFIYARPFEQIRNDVCLHDLDVKLIGNGGGYAYGVMGPTHHALEDYGVLLTLPNMRAYIPPFEQDVPQVIQSMAGVPHPAYLRLGRCEKPAVYSAPPYAPWRKLVGGSKGVAIAIGPNAGSIVEAALPLAEHARPELWVVSELPISSPDLPADLLTSLARDRRLVIVEEHVAQGSAGQMIASSLLHHGIGLDQFVHLHAKGYVSGLYGSQAYHRKESGLDAETVLTCLT